MHEKQFSNRRYCKDHPNVEGVTVGWLVFWTTFALGNHQHWDDVCNIVYLKIFCPTAIFVIFCRFFFGIKSKEHWRPDPGDPPKRGVQKYLRPGPASIPFSNRRYWHYLFSRGSHHKPKKREIPFSNRRYWHYFPEKPKKTRKSGFQMRFPSQVQKKHGKSDFK